MRKRSTFKLFQDSVKISYHRCSEIICERLFSQISLQIFGEILSDGLKGQIKTSNDEITKILMWLLSDETRRKTIVAKLEESMTDVTSFWRLFEIPVEIIVHEVCKLLGCDKKFAAAVGKLSSLACKAGYEFSISGPYGSLLSVVWWIGGEFAAMLINNLLAWTLRGNHGDQTKTWLKRIELNTKNMFLVVRNYIIMCKRSEDNFSVSIEETSVNLLTSNDTDRPIERVQSTDALTVVDSDNDPPSSTHASNSVNWWIDLSRLGFWYCIVTLVKSLGKLRRVVSVTYRFNSKIIKTTTFDSFYCTSFNHSDLKVR